MRGGGTKAALGVCCEGVECVGEVGNAGVVKGSEKSVHRHGFPFRLSVRWDQIKFEICMYIERNFSMEVFCLLMGFKKVEDLSKGGRRGSSVSRTLCVPLLTSGHVHRT